MTQGSTAGYDAWLKAERGAARLKQPRRKSFAEGQTSADDLDLPSLKTKKERHSMGEVAVDRRRGARASSQPPPMERTKEAGRAPLRNLQNLKGHVAGEDMREEVRVRPDGSSMDGICAIFQD